MNANSSEHESYSDGVGSGIQLCMTHIMETNTNQLESGSVHQPTSNNVLLCYRCSHSRMNDAV